MTGTEFVCANVQGRPQTTLAGHRAGDNDFGEAAPAETLIFSRSARSSSSLTPARRRLMTKSGGSQTYTSKGYNPRNYGVGQ